MPPAPPPEVPLWKRAAGTVAGALKGDLGYESGTPVAQTPAVHTTAGLENVTTPGKRTLGALQLANEAADTLTPIIGPAALEAGAGVEAAPSLGKAALEAVKSPMVRGLGEGYLAGKAAEVGTKAMGASPEVQQEATSLAQMTPMLAHAVAGGNYEALPTEPVPRAEALFRSLVYNHTGTVLPDEMTLEQFNAAHRAAAFNLHPDVNPAHMEDMQNLNQSADVLRQSGKFQPAPAPPAPRQPGEPPLALPGQPAPMHSISQEEIQEIGDKIAKLPVEERPHATLAAHTTLATELLNQGKLTIDGKVEIVRNQKQAETLAQRLINEEIGRQDAQSKKAASEPVPAPPAGFVIDEEPKEAGQPSQTFAVGDRVVLPKGDTGTVRHASSRLMRVAVDGGGMASVPASQWDKVQRAKVESGNGGPTQPSAAQPTAESGVVRGTVPATGGANEAAPGDAVHLGPGAAKNPDGVPGLPVPGGASDAVEQAAKSDASKGSIIFSRHGETKLDQAGANETVAGWTKEPLDDRGKASAAKLADEIKDQKPTVIVTSDLPRAKQTADIVGKQLNIPVQEDARLRPQHVPETEGLKVGEATPIWNAYESSPDKKPEGGESWNEARTRQDAALKDVDSKVAAGERPVVVTHSRNIAQMAPGERLKPGGFITKSGREEGGSVEPAKKVESANGATVRTPGVISTTQQGGESGLSAGGGREPAVSGTPEKAGEPAPVAKPAEAAPEEKPKYKFGSTQANISAEPL